MSTAMGWTGREARALRLARRMSVRAYAAHLGVSVATVSNWDSRGVLARLRTETQQILDTDLAQASNDVKERFDALTQHLPARLPVSADVSPAPTTAERRQGSTDFDSHLSPVLVDAAEVIPAVRADPPRRLGEDDVARIETTTTVFRDWDNRWGGGLSQAAVVAQLHWVAACAQHSHCTSATAKSRLLTALADLAGVTAFRCYDLKRHTEAQALWLLGLRAASEAGNTDLVGTTYRQLAHQALHLNRPDEALRLVHLAHGSEDRTHDNSERALAETAAYEGWCYAALGKTQLTHRALGRAQEHFDHADGGQCPPWLAHLDRPELTALLGHTYHVLAYHDPAMADRAVDSLTAAVAGRAEGYARSRILNLVALSATHFQRSDHIEEGIVIGDQALQGAGALDSPRALDRLRALRLLTYRNKDKPGVPAFRRRLELALADA